jgi:hypothetical protein
MLRCNMVKRDGVIDIGSPRFNFCLVAQFFPKSGNHFWDCAWYHFQRESLRNQLAGLL